MSRRWWAVCQSEAVLPRSRGGPPLTPSPLRPTLPHLRATLRLCGSLSRSRNLPAPPKNPSTSVLVMWVRAGEKSVNDALSLLHVGVQCEQRASVAKPRYSIAGVIPYNTVTVNGDFVPPCTHPEPLSARLSLRLGLQQKSPVAATVGQVVGPPLDEISRCAHQRF